MKVRIKINPDGIRDIAQGRGEAGAKLSGLIERVTQEVADNVRGQNIRVGGFKGDSGEIDLPVKTSTKVTDRVRGTVTLAHPAGIAVQAKHGALTRAASEAGLQVKEDGCLTR